MPRRNLIALDALRASASQAVCVGHALSFFGLYPATWPYVQSLSVGAFFLLSGFLICRVLKSSPDFLPFAIDRFSRIYSGWVPALIFVALIDGLGNHTGLTIGPKAFVGNLFMLQNYQGPLEHYLHVPDYGSAGPFWTLAIEWHIYMFVGAMFFLVVRNSASIGVALVALAFAYTPLRYFAGDVQPGLGTGLFAVWLIGAAMVPLADKRAPPTACLALIATAAALLCFVAPGAEYSPLAYLALALGFAGIVMAPVALDRHGSTNRFVTVVAGYSFTLYLIHYSILYHLHAAWPEGGWRAVVVGVLLSNVLALAMAWFTEMRHRELSGAIKAWLAPKRERRTCPP